MTNETETPNIISKFSKVFIERYRLSILLILSLVSFGVLAYTTLLPREGFPSIEVPIAIVQTPYFVNDVEIVNRDITIPLEDLLNDLEGVESIQSSTSNIFSVITVTFEEGVNSKDGVKLIKSEASDIDLPEGAEPNFISVDAGKINGVYDMFITLSGPGDYKAIQEKAEEIAELLEDTDVLSEANVIPIITERENPFTQETETVRERFNRVSEKDGDKLNFKKAVNIGLIKKSENIDTVQLSNAIRSEVKEIEDQGNLENYKISYTGDFAVSLNKQISSLEENAISALVIVIAVLFLLVNWRASLITGGFVIVVMTATMIGLYLIGFTLNVLSLFALILVLGLIVDDAIVVVDAIDYQKKLGVKGMNAITKALNSVGLADISGSLTTILVFVPMAGISGVLGSFIQIIPITVILALVISIFVGLTLIPFASFFAIPDKSKSGRTGILKWINKVLYLIPNLVNTIGEYVSRFVNFYIRVPLVGMLVVVGTFGLIYVGGSYASQLPFEIFPEPKDADEIQIGINYADYIDIEQAENIGKNIETFLIDNFSEEIEIASYQSANKSSATITTELQPMGSRDITAVELSERINDQFQTIEKTNISVEKTADKILVNLEFTGIDNIDEAKEKVKAVQERIEKLDLKISEPVNVDILETALDIESNLTADLEKLEEEFGFSVKANIVSAGPPASDYQFAMQLFNEDTRTLSGAVTEISNFIRSWKYSGDDSIKTIEVIEPNYDTIFKNDGRRFVQIQARISENADTAAVLSLTEDIKKQFTTDKLDELNLSEDALGFDLGQESENLESFESAIITTIVALIVMYVLLVIQFNSFSLPLLIFLAIPFSFPGLFPGLYFTNNPFSFFTMIGIIGLIGIVVNNTIMLLDYAKQSRVEGKTIRESIVEATKVRFRPLLTTSATTIVGLIPLSISDPFWESLGFSIIFGLTSSTILVVCAFPVYYMALEYLRFLRNEVLISIKAKKFKNIINIFITISKKFLYPIVK